ncbi:hypothetical protein SCUP515_05540 [Seiridium cupressi]
MLLPSVLPILVVGLSSFGLTKGEPIPTITATPTALAERQLSTIKASTTCATDTSGVVSPAPSGAVCGVTAVSSGGVTIVSYTSGANIQSLATCGKVCLQTSGCTNLYFALNQYCNLHSGAETQCSALVTAITTTSAAATCTTDAVGLASSQPSGAVCDVLSHSTGGTTIISYTSGQYILSLANCKDICLGTSNCTNLYFAQGQYCNLHSGAETHVANSASPFAFYDASCFSCPSQSSSSQTTTSSTTSISSKTSTFTLATTTSLTSSSTTTPQGIPWASIETDPALYNMAVTTTFTQPPECTGEHVTQMA